MAIHALLAPRQLGSGMRPGSGWLVGGQRLGFGQGVDRVGCASVVGALTREHVQSLQALANTVVRGLEAVEQDYHGRQRINELLNVQPRLAVENGQKIIHARCLLGEHCLQVAHTSPRTFPRDSGCKARCAWGHR